MKLELQVVFSPYPANVASSRKILAIFFIFHRRGERCVLTSNRKKEFEKLR
jgi:hypothetical protein